MSECDVRKPSATLIGWKNEPVRLVNVKFDVVDLPIHLNVTGAPVMTESEISLLQWKWSETPPDKPQPTL